ncbi:protein spinster homolog 1 isoform X4 [Pan paniscus]|uniref:protein spinster homolog 1 isoform X4 n=1 Tax=Pan paniscus TaxID=9597 RepID=UPI003003E406
MTGFKQHGGCRGAAPGLSDSKCSGLLPRVGSSVGPERGRARPPGTMAGSDTAPFLSQADDPDDGPVPGTPGLPGSTGNPKSEEPEVPDQEGLQRITGLSPGRSALIVAVLCYINLLNYMDRFTVAGVLPDIEQFFNIGDSSSGLIQTVFISSYMVLAPVFGYLGDRYNRKYLMCGGIAFWSLVTLGSSFIPGEHFWLLLLTRGLVGVGEASYSTIAPTLIADLFVADQRSRMLSIFYFAIPVGSGLGYIAGSKVKDMAGDWHWALRIFIFIGETLLSMNWAIVADILLYVVIPTRRSTAEAFQIVLSHLLGDAGSPYLIGLACCTKQGPQTTGLWCPSGAAPPACPWPVCSSERLPLTYLHICHSWPWAHPTKGLGLTPWPGPASRGTLGRVPAPRHYMGSSGEEVGVQEGDPSPQGQPQGLGAICNRIKFVARPQVPALVFLWVASDLAPRLHPRAPEDCGSFLGALGESLPFWAGRLRWGTALLRVSWLSVTVSHAPASLEPVPCLTGLAEVGVGTALCTPEFPLSGPPCSLPPRVLDMEATAASWQVAVPVWGGQQTLGECLGWLPGLLLPPPHWQGGVGRGRVQPAESLMISCPRPALTTASCRRRAGGQARRGGRRGGAGRAGTQG